MALHENAVERYTLLKSAAREVALKCSISFRARRLKTIISDAVTVRRSQINTSTPKLTTSRVHQRTVEQFTGKMKNGKTKKLH